MSCPMCGHDIVPDKDGTPICRFCREPVLMRGIDRLQQQAIVEREAAPQLLIKRLETKLRELMGDEAYNEWRKT